MLNFTLIVYNLQSVTQSYILKNTFNPAKWPIEFNDQPFEVEAKSLKEIDVQLSIPAINEVGWYNLSFIAQSDRDPKISGSAHIPIHLLPELAVTELIPTNTAPVVHEVVKFKATVRNLGPAAAWNFHLNFYNGTEIIDSYFVESLYSNKDFVYDLTWVPEAEGEYNITAYVNPVNTAENFIIEMASRYFNNVKAISITVHGTAPPPNGNNGNNDGQNNGTGNNKEDNTQFFWITVGATALVIFIFLGILISRRLLSLKEVGKTAKKIPLDNDPRVQGKTSAPKTARKEKLPGYRAERGSSHASRARSKYANRAAQRKKYRK
jgi:hypothetical protein